METKNELKVVVMGVINISRHKLAAKACIPTWKPHSYCLGYREVQWQKKMQHKAVCVLRALLQIFINVFAKVMFPQF